MAGELSLLVLQANWAISRVVAVQQRFETVDDLLRRGRAASDSHGDWEQVFKWTCERVGCGKHATAQGAVAECCDDAWFGHRFVSREQGAAHVNRHRSSDKQNICMAR